MRIGIITERALTKKHGTGAQILRLLSGSEADFFHLYFEPGHGDVSDCGPSCNLIGYDMPAWKRYSRRYQIANQLAYHFQKGWWDGNDRVHPRRFARLQQQHALRCDVAYVVLGSEIAARRCVSLLSHLKCPYVVHIMDLYHDELTPSEMPGFQQLLGGAAATIVITRPIAEQVAKFGIQNAQVIFIGQETAVAQARPPMPGSKIQVIMAGHPYQGGLDVLEKALPEIEIRFPQVTFAYMGADFDSHSDGLKSRVHNYGYIADPAVYQRLLAESHLAYLTGPSERDCLGRYSFPSRTSDYLMAGLPVLACVAEGTATEQALLPLEPDAVRFTRAPQQLLAGLDYFLGSEQAWCRAGGQAREFALAHTSIDVVRSQVFAILQQASRTGS